MHSCHCEFIVPNYVMTRRHGQQIHSIFLLTASQNIFGLLQIITTRTQFRFLPVCCITLASTTKYMAKKQQMPEKEENNMSENPMNHGTSNALIRTSELMLMLFAAFLLLAAYPGKNTVTNPGPVNVNLPASDQKTETLHTAHTDVTDESQPFTVIAKDETTTALLSNPTSESAPLLPEIN